MALEACASGRYSRVTCSTSAMIRSVSSTLRVTSAASRFSVSRVPITLDRICVSLTSPESVEALSRSLVIVENVTRRLVEGRQQTLLQMVKSSSEFAL